MIGPKRLVGVAVLVEVLSENSDAFTSIALPIEQRPATALLLELVLPVLRHYLHESYSAARRDSHRVAGPVLDVRDCERERHRDTRAFGFLCDDGVALLAKRLR